jgi:hypothetical protein
MRLIKTCVRCNGAFLATKNMLVCGKCYGSQEDIELSRVIRQGEFIRDPSDAYLDYIDFLVTKLRRDSHGV